MVLTMNVNGQLVTHRLLGFRDDGTLLTKGDNNPVFDDWGNAAVKVVGLYRFRIPYLGYLVDLVDIFSPGVSGAWFVDEDMLGVSISTACKEGKTQGTSISVNMTAAGSFDEAPNVFSVSGEICVSNQGEVETEGLKIFAQVEAKNKGGGKFQVLPSAVFYLEPSEFLPSGETRCYAYSIVFEPVEAAHYRLSAQVFIDNHSGWLPGGPHCGLSEICPFGPVVKSGFELPDVGEVDEGEPEMSVPDPEMTPSPTLTPQPTPTPEATEPSELSDSPEPSPDDLSGETPTPQESENPEKTAEPPGSE
jgi:hypothetical protein